jgi:hypothetical protein
MVNYENRKVVPPNAQLTGKKLLAKISERSEQKANCFLSLLNFLLGLFI